MRRYNPLINGVNSRTYNSAFLLGAITTTITTLLAVHFSKMSSDRIEETGDCSLERKQLFCHIKSSAYTRNAEIVLQTFTSTLVIHYFLFFIFGAGGSSLSAYYKPSYNDVRAVTTTAIIIVLTNLLFYYTIILTGRGKSPPVYDLLHSVFEQYGYAKRNVSKDKQSSKDNTE